MKKEIIFLILAVGILVILGSLEFLLKEKSPEKELTNNPPKVETRGTGVGCGIAVAEMFFYFFDPDPEDYLTAYQLQIDDNSDFSNCPGENCPFDTGKETKIKETLKSYDSTYKYSIPKELPKKVYFWRLRVWDSKDNPSDWSSAELDLR